MCFRLVLIAGLFATIQFWGQPGAVAEQKSEQPGPGKSPDAKKAKQTSLTGCIDEQEGQYVLIHDQTRDLIANLEADGFPTEGFARHLGHKVTVRGTAGPAAGRPVFRVRSVETVSGVCGPEH
jgi:hypothetical protein